MQLKNQTYKIKGMNKDLSYSSFNPEYSWHNKNIRLTARDGNDLLSVTNERGNIKINHNEYFREPAPTVYDYVAFFSGYVNVMEPLTYSYSAAFSDYKNVMEPPTYSYSPLFSNYSNTLIDI